MTDLNDVIAAGREAAGLDATVVARLTEMTGDFAVNLVVAALILAGTLLASRWAAGLVRRTLGRLRTTRDDRTLQGFLVQVVRVLVLAIGLVAVLQRLGVQTTSIIAVLGAASLAIGLALQGTLSNVAAGVMLLILRPYRVGDVVQVGDRAGTVQRLDLFTTGMVDANNMRITVPNARVLGDIIINISGQRTRRIEFPMGVDYDSDLPRVLDLVRETASAHPKVLADPPPWAGVTNMLDSAVEVTVQAWVRSEDWWQTRADLMLAMKAAFDAAGVVIPYPHQVHLPRSAAAPRPPSKASLRRAARHVENEPQSSKGAAGKAAAMGAGQGGS